MQRSDGPAAGPVGGAGPAAVSAGDSVYDGQSQASSSLAARPPGISGAGKTLEGLRQVLSRESGAADPDGQMALYGIAGGAISDSVR